MNRETRKKTPIAVPLTEGKSGKRPASRHAERLAEFAQIITDAKSLMKKTAGLYRDKKLEKDQAIAQLAWVNAVHDIADIYQNALQNGQLPQNPLLENAIVASCTVFIRAVQARNYLLQDNVTLQAGGSEGITHALDLYDFFMRPIQPHLEALQRIGVAVTPAQNVLSHAQDYLEFAGSMGTAGRS